MLFGFKLIFCFSLTFYFSYLIISQLREIKVTHRQLNYFLFFLIEIT